MKFGKRQMDIEELAPAKQGALGTGRGMERADMKAAAMAEADKRFGQPHYGHSDNEPAPAYVQTNDDPLKLGGPVPQTMGRTADLYKDVRDLRLAMEKEVEVVKARESELKEYIINNLSKSDDTGAAGLRYRAQIVIKDIPRPVDWPKIHTYVMENNRFDLLQKRLGEKAVMDMLADGQTIPGVEVAHIPDISITKI